MVGVKRQRKPWTEERRARVFRWRLRRNNKAAIRRWVEYGLELYEARNKPANPASGQAVP